MAPRRVLIYICLGLVPFGCLVAVSSVFSPGLAPLFLLGLLLTAAGAVGAVGIALYTRVEDAVSFFGGLRQVVLGARVRTRALAGGHPTDPASLAQMALDVEADGAGWQPDTVLRYAEVCEHPDPPYLKELSRVMRRGVEAADEGLRKGGASPSLTWAGRDWVASELRTMCLRADAALWVRLGPEEDDRVLVEETPRPSLPPAVLQALTPLEVDYGEVLMEEGQRDPSLVVVVEGEVELSLRQVDFARVGAGELVGELAVFGDGVRVASARTLTACTLAGLELEGLEALRRQGSPVAEALEEHALTGLAERLGAVEAETARITEPVESPWQARREGWLREALRGPPPPRIPRGEPPVDALARLLPRTPLDAVREIAAGARWRALDSGELLWAQGAAAQEVYLVASGLVSTFVAAPGEDPRHATRVVELHVRETGDLVGLPAFRGGAWRTSCGALDEADVLVLPMEMLSRARADVLRLLSVRTASAIERLVSLEEVRRQRVQDDLEEHLGADGRPRQILRFGVGGHRGG